MTFTVALAIDLPTIKAGDARILTGDDGLDRDVRWVHSSEIPDIAQFLRGGEMLLTAGLGIGCTDGEQRAYVRGVAAAGAAALVIEESGRAFARVPPAIVEEGKRNGLPIVALTHEVSFAAVCAEVHDILTQQQLQTIRQERDIESRFSELLLQGGDYVAIVQDLASLSASTVVLEDNAHRLAVCRVREGDVFTPANWSLHAQTLHEAHGACVRRPILMRGQRWGWIHVLDGQSPDRRYAAEFVAERAAASIAIALLTDRSREAVDGQRSTALLTHLMTGDMGGVECIEHAERLGYRLGKGKVFVSVANKKEGDDGSTFYAPDLFEAEVMRADMGTYVIVVASQQARPRVTRFLGAGDRFHGCGTSRNVSGAELALAVRQAKTAAAVARISGSCLQFDDLGIERILVSLAEGPELAAFVDDELGPVLTVDADSRTPLMPTLRAFLAADGRKTEAADVLFIQRRTLYNRLDRLSAILGRSLEDAETRQRLFLAVKGLDLLDGAVVTRPR